jgi:hypothetical protein
MELVKSTIIDVPASSDAAFLKANTESILITDLQQECVIPVFAKDNESTISHQSFIDVVYDSVLEIFGGESILSPAIRVSHPIKGRIPEAMGKPAKELLPHEKTLYYERMAFVIEIPTIFQEINGQRLSLTIGGVRAYNHENLYSRKTEENFKLFVGFKNFVCTNLCISTDGYLDKLKARTLAELRNQSVQLIGSFNPVPAMKRFERLGDFALTESQFAYLIGRSRLYHNHPAKKELTTFPLPEVQVVQVVQGYYNDAHFKASDDGRLSLWNLYNLFTGANKSSYIDTFLGRNVASITFAESLANSLEFRSPHWYID